MAKVGAGGGEGVRVTLLLPSFKIPSALDIYFRVVFLNPINALTVCRDCIER